MNKRIRKKKFKKVNDKLEKILKEAAKKFEPISDDLDKSLDEDLDVHFSKEHEEKMRKLFREARF